MPERQEHDNKGVENKKGEFPPPLSILQILSFKWRQMSCLLREGRRESYRERERERKMEMEREREGEMEIKDLQAQTGDTGPYKLFLFQIGRASCRERV